MKFDLLEERQYPLMAAMENAGGNGVAVTNTPLTTGEAEANAPELIQPDIEKAVMKYKPEATPIDQILRIGKSTNVNAMEFGYYAVDSRPESTELATAYAKSAQTSGRVQIDATNNDVFDLTDTILFPGTPCKGGVSQNLVCVVVGKSDDGKLVVLALNGEDATNGEWKIMPSVKKGAKMVRMGRAAGELDVQSPMLETLPKRLTNYCQIFKMQIEESTLLEVIKNKEAKWNFSDLEENAIYELRKGMEKSFLFGIKSKIYDTNRKQNTWTTEGIWHQCTKEFHYSTDEFTQKSFVDLCKLAFTGNSGHNRRCLIAGSDFVSMVSKLDTNRQLHGTDTEVVWGITWTKVVTNFGSLYLLHDEVFDQVGMSGNGIIVDPEFLSKRIFKPMDKLDLDLVKSGQRNTNARVITEISGVVLKYPDAHVKIIQD